MRWITAVALGLVVGFGATYVALSDERPARPASASTSVAERVEVSPTVPPVVPVDTAPAEHAGCEQMRALGPSVSAESWVQASAVLAGTRLGREAAAVRYAHESGGSRALVYAAVLDLLEACL